MIARLSGSVLFLQYPKAWAVSMEQRDKFLGLKYLEFYSFPPRTRPDFNDLACELDADGLGGKYAPLILDETV
jgi:hypothetical protein